MDDAGAKAAISFGGLVLVLVGFAVIVGASPSGELLDSGVTETRVGGAQVGNGVFQTVGAGPVACGQSVLTHHVPDAPTYFNETQIGLRENATTDHGLRTIHVIHDGQLVYRTGVEIGETRAGVCAPPGESRLLALDKAENTIGTATITLTERTNGNQ